MYDTISLQRKNVIGKYPRGNVMKNKRTWVCYYINSYGDERHKVFDNIEDGLAFTRLLDKRIEKGTCGGYSFMEL
jgi:hypothetical protein